jgi:hypothetical protein
MDPAGRPDHSPPLRPNAPSANETTDPPEGGQRGRDRLGITRTRVRHRPRRGHLQERTIQCGVRGRGHDQSSHRPGPALLGTVAGLWSRRCEWEPLHLPRIRGGEPCRHGRLVVRIGLHRSSGLHDPGSERSRGSPFWRFGLQRHLSMRHLRDFHLCEWHVGQLSASGRGRYVLEVPHDSVLQLKS